MLAVPLEERCTIEAAEVAAEVAEVVEEQPWEEVQP